MGETMTIQEVVSTVLTDTLTMVGNPERWTQRAWARDAKGRSLSQSGLMAEKPPKCWCLDGALRRVVYRDRKEWLMEAVKEIAPDADEHDRRLFPSQVYRYAHAALCGAFRTIVPGECYADDLWAWNDETTHTAVVHALKLAVTRERAGLDHG